MSVDGARDTVGELDVELGESVLGVDRSVGDVTDGSGLDDVPDGESLDAVEWESVVALDTWPPE